MMQLLANIIVLTVGGVLLSYLQEVISRGDRQEPVKFSLPLANIVLVIVIGGALSLPFGWAATGVALGAYALWSVIAGVLTRRTDQGDGDSDAPSTIGAEPPLWEQAEGVLGKVHTVLSFTETLHAERVPGGIGDSAGATVIDTASSDIKVSQDFKSVEFRLNVKVTPVEPTSPFSVFDCTMRFTLFLKEVTSQEEMDANLSDRSEFHKYFLPYFSGVLEFITSGMGLKPLVLNPMLLPTDRS